MILFDFFTEQGLFLPFINIRNSMFGIYLELGFKHISDLKGYDHILFIVALCAIYRPAEWKKVALLATAFTVGHSITLALAALDVVRFPAKWVEFLIPVTICLTAVYNVTIGRQLSEAKGSGLRSKWMLYLLPLIFGLIHGMGFSNFLRSALLPGEEHDLVYQLLAFNIGVELGQLCIVGVIMALTGIALSLMRTKQPDWKLFISGTAFGPALIMALERWPG